VSTITYSHIPSTDAGIFLLIVQKNRQKSGKNSVSHSHRFFRVFLETVKVGLIMLLHGTLVKEFWKFVNM